MARWEHKAKILIGLLAALTMGLTACGEDEESVVGGQLAEIEVNPETINFTNPRLGETSEEAVRITNTGEGTLRIFSMRLEEEGGGNYDGKREFARGTTGWENGTIEIGPGDSHRMTVNYTPENTVGDSGQIVLEVNLPGYENGFEIPVQSGELAPRIDAAPSNVDFDRVNVDEDPKFRMLFVSNQGAAPLVLRDIYVAGSQQFWISFPQPTAEEEETGAPPAVENDIDTWTGTLQPSESIRVRVWFDAEDSFPEEGELVFESNDPVNSTYEVDLRANSGSPCLHVSPGEELVFGQASLGQTTQRTVTLENCSRSHQLNLSEIALTDDGGGVFDIQSSSLPGDLPESEAVLDAGERANFVVTFVPTLKDDYTGELVIRSNDTAYEDGYILPISGVGTDNNCPTARARARLQGGSYRGNVIETLPLNTIEFDATQSTDPDGSVDRYEWTILSRPQGSTQRMRPSADDPNPELFLDLAGIYEVELKVYDEENAVSCGDPSIITINAEPDADVHIQLVWDTPSDPDQTDAFGTDLDLHYIHPNAERWDQAPWDIYWRNTSADWARENYSGDDPSLDIDDTDGAGPENINHSRLENLRYKTGVYYYNDNGLGASYATVRIYVHGQLKFELPNKYMPGTGSFWEVAAIIWPSGDILNLSRMYQGFPSP